MTITDGNNNKIRITITKNSVEIVSRLIRKEFDRVNTGTDYIYKKAPKLIQTAKEWGLLELADEMQNDLKI